MLQTFLLPDVGEGLTEAEIVAWRVAEGDVIKVNDVLVEIETAKSIVELPSPYAGTVKSLLVSEGTEIEVGTPIVEIDDGSDDDAPEPVLVGYGASEAPSRRRRRGQHVPDRSASEAMASAYEQRAPGRSTEEVHPAEPVRAEAVGDPLPGAGEAPSESALVLVEDNDPRAKPPVRKYAADLGVDLSTVVGTGPDGTITRRDVEAALAFQRLEQEPRQGRVMNDQATFGGEQRAYTATGSHGFGNAGGGAAGFGDFGAGFDPFEGRAERRVPIRGVRKVTAENMVRSVNTHVHVTEWVTVDVTGTMEFVETLKQRREFTGLRISPLLVYAKAICLALSRNPELNSEWDEERQEIVYYRDVNLGIAAATPRGLMVPNIKNAGRLSLLQLSQAINQLVQVAKDGKLQPADYSGGTFTITNVGVFGIDAGTPIINGNESAIFCMGSIQRRPWVVGEGADERVEPRWVTTLAVAFDHRIIDGEQGSRFLHDVASILAEPALALLF